MSCRIAKVATVGALMMCGSQVCAAQRVTGMTSPARWRAASAQGAVLAAAARSGLRPDSLGQSPNDTFLGPDKVKHFLMSAFIEAMGFGVLQAAGANRSASLAAATTVTIATGIGREIHDGRTKGLFSLGDLTWDAMGTAAALLAISHSQR